MLHIHHSNQLESLTNSLLDSYSNDHRHPFTPRIIISEAQSLSRWLKNRICLHEGIVCLTETELPAAWLWQQARLSLSMPKHDDPLTHDRLQWRIFAALDQHSSFWSQPELNEVSHYLSDANDLKRWQLAGRIADAFDRYQYYRPDTIRDWSGGQKNDWQAHLWRYITTDIGIHRVALMDSFLRKLHSGETTNLPERIDLFAIHNLPPLLLQAFHGIARHTNTHLWLLSPTPEYWADLANPREMARKRRESPDELALWQAGNPLLTQWGRQAQSFQDLLLDDSIQLQDDSEHFINPGNDTLLHQIQSDIFDAIAPEKPLEKKNISSQKQLPSLQLHICHSALRECQVLHDNLLHCLQEEPGLQPENILVLVPEISHYAPYIEAVFGSIADNTRIPYNISDVFQADEHPLIQAFLNILNLPESRFSQAEVIGLANIPQIRQRFGLEETDMAELSDLFNQLRIFWGLNGADKQRFNLPEIDDNTWHQGFMRIMAGFAMGDEKLLANDPPIAPAPRIAADSAERAARFFDLLDTLRRWASRLSQPAEPAEWAERISLLLEDIFAPTDDDDERPERILETIRDLRHAETGGVKKLSLEVVRYWLNQNLGTQVEKGRLYSGGVTFCAMQPLRGVPFRIIALLGMQEAAYPRRSYHNEFDRMNDNWQHGDPNPVQEDRYLFLESLLAARDKFIISYTGRNAKNNDPLQPSVLVQELLDYLDEHYQCNDGSPNSRLPSEQLTRVHPLHPFSAGNYTMQPTPEQMANHCPATSHAAGFDRRWLQTAKAIHQHKSPQPHAGWPTSSIDAAEHFERHITPQALAHFFKSPIKHFVNKRLRLYQPIDQELMENEPFELDGLEQWQLRNLLLQSWLQDEGDSNNTASQLARAQGMLLHGTQGEVLFAKIQSEFEAIKTQCIDNDITPPLISENIDINLQLTINKNHWQLSGRVNGVYSQHGLLEITASKYSLTKLLPLWIRHLCLHASGHHSATSRFIGLDQMRTLKPVTTDKAREHLSNLLALYEAGLVAPLAFSDYTSATFIEKLNSNGDEEKALKAAQGKWLGGFKQHAEGDDFHNRIVLHNHQWQPDETMTDLAHLILDPLTQNLGQENE